MYKYPGMKKVLLFFIFCFISYTTFAQWLWAKQPHCTRSLGTVGTADGSDATAIAIDDENNVYMVGLNAGDTIHFGAYTFYDSTHIPDYQTVIAKYDTSGNVVWANASLTGNSWPSDITTDHFGNVYVFGYFDSASVRFGPNVLTESTAVGVDGYFILKYNSLGSLLWVRSVAGKHFYDVDVMTGASITADREGNIYITGSFRDSILTIGAYPLSNACVGYGSSMSADIFIAKYDSTGGVVWAKRFGGTSNDLVYSLRASLDDKLYLNGYSQSPSISFGSTSFSDSIANMFLVEIDTGGNVIWAVAPIGKVLPVFNTMTVDKTHDIYACGIIDGISPVIFGPDTFYDAPYAAVIFKYDSSGTPLWGNIINTTTPGTGCEILGIAVDVCNNVWVTGGVAGGGGLDVKFNDSLIIPLPGNAGCFFAAYDENGLLIEHSVLTEGGNDDQAPLVADNSGNIYLFSDYGGVDTTNIIGGDTLTRSASVGENIFLAKYKAIHIDSVFAHTDTAVCSNSDISNPIVLTAPAGGTSYTWFNGNTGSVDTALVSGVFWVSYYMHCTWHSDTFRVTVNQQPGPITGHDSVCSGNITTLYDPVPGGIWSSSNIAIATIDSNSGVATGITPGSTIIKYTASNSCFVTSAFKVLAPPCITSVNEIFVTGNTLDLFPVPATDELTIQVSKGVYNSFAITNAIGQVLIQQQINATHTLVDVNKLIPGLYYISFSGKNGNAVRKFVKE